MGNGVDCEELILMKLARSIELDCQEGVKWERRKLERILEEDKRSDNQNPSQAT